MNDKLLYVLFAIIGWLFNEIVDSIQEIDAKQ